MKDKYFKAGLVLSILILGNMIAPSFCANPVANSMIEEQMNNNFKSFISNLPEDTAEPLKNTLNYIKNRSKCNDYEAVQINALMAIHSNQYQGYDYYVRYMIGNTTSEEDGADYYRAIRLEWDQYLKEYADMTPAQRSSALMTSATNDDVTGILNNASPEELEYVQGRSEPYENKIEDLSNELSSKSTSWMIGHIGSVEEYGDKINEASDDLNEAIVAADKEWHINNHNEGSTESVNFNPFRSNIGFSTFGSEYDEDAYPNALHVFNELKKLGYDYHIDNSFDEGRSNINVGDLVQYRIDSSNVNKPMYKYLLIKSDTNDEYGIDTLDLIPRDTKGNRIEKSGEDIAEIHRFQHDRVYIPKFAVTPDNSKYTIHANVASEYRVNELYTAYDTDCTSLQSRLGDITPIPDVRDQSDGIAKISSGIVTTIGGCVSIGIGIKAICGSLAAVPATGGISAIGLGPGIALLLAGIGVLASGVAMIASGSLTIEKYSNNKKLHKDGERDIFNDIGNHNRCPISI